MASYSSESSTSLATACPSCSTVFRVVQDQLKVSQGWVRCGRCHEVFNALEGLFDLDNRRGGETGAATFAGTNIPSAPAPGNAAAPRSSSGAAASAPAATQGGWDETSPAMFSGNRSAAAGRPPADAPGAGAALLRERLAARVAAANAAAGHRPGGAASHDEAEQDTRFEPKFFEHGPPAVVHAPTQADAKRGAPEVDLDTGHPAGGGTGGAELPLDAAASAEVAHRREPWLAASPANASTSAHARTDSGSTSPSPERGQQRWAEAMGEVVEEAEDASDAFRPTQALLQPEGPVAPLGATGRGRVAGESRAGGNLPDPMEPHLPAVIQADRHGPASLAGPLTQPGFLREAERKARWQRPWVRATLAVCCVLLLGLAVVQLGLKNRDRYAAKWPLARSALLELCSWVGCTLQAPRQIEALVVETSSLTRPPGVDGLRLQLVLRNRIDYDVAAPHVELSLTDATGAIMARKVFNPGEFGVIRAVVGGQQDANWSLVFSTSLRNIAGYSVSVFYP